MTADVSRPPLALCGAALATAREGGRAGKARGASNDAKGTMLATLLGHLSHVPAPRLAAPLALPTAGLRLRAPSSAMSVSGVLYEAPDTRPRVKLFTKAGCTLCDKAKAVLAQAAEQQPHTLEAVDITDPDKAEWWGRYKYDIPVLHVDGVYWAKHRCARRVPCASSRRIAPCTQLSPTIARRPQDHTRGVCGRPRRR